MDFPCEDVDDEEDHEKKNTIFGVSLSLDNMKQKKNSMRGGQWEREKLIQFSISS
jgi:hypothetical protein